MDKEMRALSADEIDFVAGGLLDLGITAALARQTQVGFNTNIAGIVGGAQTALQALTATQTVIAAGAVS